MYDGGIHFIPALNVSDGTAVSGRDESQTVAGANFVGVPVGSRGLYFELLSDLNTRSGTDSVEPLNVGHTRTVLFSNLRQRVSFSYGVYCSRCF